MKQGPKEFSAVSFAYDIIHMQRRLDAQEAELEGLREYRQKYIDLLNSSIAHSGHMMGGLLQIAMKLGVMDAIGRANAGELK